MSLLYWTGPMTIFSLQLYNNVWKIAWFVTWHLNKISIRWVWPSIHYTSMLRNEHVIGRRKWNITTRYVDDVLSIENPEVENYMDQMYHVEIEIKDTIANNNSSYLEFTSVDQEEKTTSHIALWHTTILIFIKHFFYSSYMELECYSNCFIPSER